MCWLRLLIIIGAFSAGSLSCKATGLKWTSRTSVGTKYLVEDPTGLSLEWSTSRGKPVVWAPDKKHFYYIMRWGEVESDSNIYELTVFSYANVEAGFRAEGRKPSPEFMVRHKSDSSRDDAAPIGCVKWVSANELQYLGLDENGIRQLYAIDIRKKTSKKLTNISNSESSHADIPGVISFVSSSAGTVFFEVLSNMMPMKNRYPAEFLDGTTLNEEFHQTGSTGKKIFRCHLNRNGTTVSKNSPYQDYVWLSGAVPEVSPDGRYAAFLCVPSNDSFPNRWSKYSGAEAYRRRGLPRWTLIDIKTGRTSDVIDAPIGSVSTQAIRLGPTGYLEDNGASVGASPRLIWVSDSEVVLFNSCFPLGDDRSSLGAGILYVNVKTSEVSMLGKMHEDLGNGFSRRATSCEWLADMKTLRVVYKEVPNGRLTYQQYADGAVVNLYWRREGTVWSHQAALVTHHQSSVPVESLKVEIREDANTPPTVVAIHGDVEVVLNSSNLGAQNAEMAHAMVIDWTESDGVIGRGLLMMPKSGHGSPPLVIQLYRCMPNMFRPDGPFPSSFAAQSLVSAGFAVLGIDLPGYGADPIDRSSGLAEKEAIVRRVDAAVQRLSTLKNIDVRRVGLVGFSRGGYLAYHLVLNPGRTNVRAAVIADSFTGGFLNYVIDAARFGAMSFGVTSAEKQYDGGFWQANVRENWLTSAPPFAVDRVRSACLFTYHGSALSGAYEAKGAFALNRKIYDAIYFPNGSHQLQRPKERIASLDATVDWMNFWLNDLETGGSDKEKQYQRWRALKAASHEKTLSQKSERKMTTSELPWVSDIDRATSDGKSGMKNLLIVFTGTQWCPPCRELQKTVFESSQFADYAKGVIPVLCDLDREQRFRRNLTSSMKRLLDQYKPEGFPTVIEASPDGTEIRRVVGFAPGTTAADFLLNFGPSQRDHSSSAEPN